MREGEGPHLSGRRARRVLAGLAIAASCLLAVDVLARLLPFPFGNNAGNAEVECGEMLLHGRAGADFDVSYTMPLAAVSSAYLYGHAGLEVSRWLWAAAFAAVYVLTFALGVLLGGWAAGALSCALLVPLAPTLIRYPISSLYALSVLLTGGLLVRRARAPTPGNGAWLGLALGLSLLHRSPLVFFPLALAALDAAFARGRRAWLKGVAPVVVVPVLLLLPWIAMNWALRGEFVPLERGRIPGLLLSSIGFVQKTQADAGFFAGSSAVLGAAISSWMRAALREPAAYLGSSLGRLGFIAAPHPLLLLAAGAGALFGRRRPEYRALALLAGYLAAIHCLIAISEAYLVPLWPLLAALAGAAIPAAFGRSPAGESRAQALASRGFALALLPASLAGLLALGLAAAYPFRAAAPPAAGPAREAWVLLDDGRRRLGRGELAAAREDFTRALAQRPEETRIRFYLLWTEALEGHSSALLSLDPAALESTLVRPYGLAFLKAAEHLRAGRPALARIEIEQGLSLWERPPSLPLLEQLSEFLAPMPARERERLLRAVADAAGTARIPDVRLELARLSAARGERGRALAGLAGLDSVELSPSEAGELASLYTRLGKPERAFGALTRRARGKAGAQPWLDRAAFALERGEEASALDSIDRALSLSPEPKAGLAAARLLRRAAKKSPRALGRLRTLARSAPGEAGLWHELAAAELDTGELDAARRSLETAATLEPRAGLTLPLALLFRRAGRPERAEQLLRAAAGAPENALDRAALALDGGRRREALLALAAAEKGESRPEILSQIANRFAQAGDPARARRILERLAAAEPERTQVSADLAALELDAGARDAALRTLERAAAAGPGPDGLRQLVRLFARAGRSRRGAELLSRLSARQLSEDPAFDIELASAALESADRLPALEALGRVEHSALAPDLGRRAALLLVKAGEGPRALTLARGQASGRPDDPEGWLALAGIALDLGRQDLAAEALRKAEPASRSLVEGKRLAQFYDEHGLGRQGCAFLGVMARRFPADAGVLQDKGVCDYLDGRAPEAERALRAAIRLDPALLGAYLSLGAICTDQHRLAEALALYERALSRARAGDPLAQRLLEARDELRSRGKL